MTAVVVMALGGWIIVHYQSTPAQIQAETARDLDEFVPHCGWSSMESGETCLDFSGDGSGGGSYSDLVEQYRASHTPQVVADWHDTMRTVGAVVIGLGLLLLVGLGLRVVFAGAARRRLGERVAAANLPEVGDVRPGSVPEALSPPVVEPAGPPPSADGLGVTSVVVCTVLLALCLWWVESVWSLSWGMVAAVVVTLIVGMFLAAVRSTMTESWRSQRARPRWAAAHGYVFRRHDPDLLDRLGIEGLRHSKPYAERVVWGEIEGAPFVVFDFRGDRGRPKTAWVMALPRPVPADEKGALLARLKDAVAYHHPGDFTVDETVIWELESQVSGSSMAALGEYLAGLRRVGALLAGARAPVQGV
ncbi:hypothetical protein [Actinoplanes sp. NPDC051851]|uniref:hypothetical protein n=1 Tax=Actinoplanes sp. NPDC051851 TaxID=3154753 RepID=UPI00342257B3